jgi:uncharacterized phage infection (PIP) family protein YhgE
MRLRFFVASLAVCSIILLGTNCGESREDAIQKRISDARDKAEKLKSDIDELKDHIDELKEHLEELQSDVDSFSDGSNWREVVPEVESKTSELDSDGSQLQTESDDIATQAEELSSELDSFFRDDEPDDQSGTNSQKNQEPKTLLRAAK